MNLPIIISLGGSLIVPEEIDIAFLEGFKEIILREVQAGKRFVIITGGGKICRKYQDAARALGDLSSSDLDWLGIHSTRFNAEFTKILFGELAEEKIIIDPMSFSGFEKPILLGAGYKPGFSTDWDAVEIAKRSGAKKIINLSNIDFVYESDPRKNPNAKKFEKISWADYIALIPKDWDPGLNSPFDPVASRDARDAGIEVAIMNGKNLENFEAYLSGNSFTGTVIS